MREAPVGWQCPSCVREGARISPTVRWRPGRAGRLGVTRVTPVVIGLIVANVAMYVWQEHNRFWVATHLWLLPLGVHYQHRWWQLITSAFLHENLTHIGLNMLTLAIVGPAVEAEIGKLRFLAVYLLSAVGGSVAFYLLVPVNEYGLGASGAIFGIMGAYYVLARLRGWEVQQITGLLAINVIYGFISPGVAWQAHLGGLVVGAAVCLGLMYVPGRLGAGPGAGRRPSVRAGSATAAVVQGTAVVVAAAVVLGLLAQLPPGHVNI